ncbi:MAG: helix-turn-helix transcriptional regulator [Chthoniobacteraceae bacterium]
MPTKEEQPYIIVARNISRLRSERGITQERLCELAVVSRGYFQRIESGKANMTIEYLDRMRKALKCRWSDLFRGLDKE